MSNFKNCFAFIIGLLGSLAVTFAQTPNKLTQKEKQNGWRLLFDGQTFDGWKRLKDSGWVIKKGQLIAQESLHPKQRDIITTYQFENFELSIEFKISKLTNSGIKYLVTNTIKGYEGSYLGLEYQILDNINFKYPERGEYRSLASLYDLIPADRKEFISIGKWNVAKIIVNGNHIEHWLNGKKVVEYNRMTERFGTLVENSKYKNMENFGTVKRGHILLQNEGSTVAFRSIKIKLLQNN